MVNISTSADSLKVFLEEEVTKIVNEGHLMPFHIQYGEKGTMSGGVRHEFDEPWIMMMTLMS